MGFLEHFFHTDKQDTDRDTLEHLDEIEKNLLRFNEDLKVLQDVVSRLRAENEGLRVALNESQEENMQLKQEISLLQDYMHNLIPRKDLPQ